MSSSNFTEIYITRSLHRMVSSTDQKHFLKVRVHCCDTCLKATNRKAAPEDGEKKN